MKSFLKSKKFLIIIIALLLVVLIIMGILLFRNSNNQTNKGNNIVSDYVAYVKINPSIKLQYSQTCNDKNECTDPIVTNYELINDDAKNIYKDIDLVKNGKDLINVLNLITQTAKDNNIDFETVEIYSDWNNINKYVEEKNKNSSQNWNYSVKVSNHEELNNVKKELEETNNGGSNIDDNQSTNSESNTVNKNNEKKNNTNNNGSTNTSSDNQDPVEWTELTPGLYYNGEAEGYGDYIKTNVMTMSNGYRWAKFVDSSKLGCADANDKQACKTFWVNYWTPKVSEAKKDMESAQRSLNEFKSQMNEYFMKIEEVKNNINQCQNEQIDVCKSGEYSLKLEMLEEYNNQLVNWQSLVKNYDNNLKDLELILEAETNDYNEHLRALNIYKAL